ncbi:allantoate permease [Fusarium circinatum]|uniref:Allantoate permease n=1 Tax=Fusarium circinatum TaxID=48490 RepID=A0A8H5T410_FUSCI|nr:allantoate permease [Fusarium circinatum]
MADQKNQSSKTSPNEQIDFQDGSSHETHPNTYNMALKLAEAHASDEVDPIAEKKLVKKIDWYLMPLMCMTYAFQYYDKVMIGHGAIFGLREDLDIIQGLRYSNCTMIFFCGFIVGCYPLSILGQKFPTAKVCAAICFLWAIVVLSTPACTSYSGFMANRFFLGLIEAGVSPLFMLVTSKWYTNEEQVLRMGFWYSSGGAVNLVSPMINYGLGSIKGSIAGWRILYIFAGALTLLWSFVVYAFFPDSPVTAKRLTEDERALAILRLRKNNTGFENTRLKPRQIWETLVSYQFWSLCLLGMLCSTATSAANTFSSLVFKGLGFTVFHTLLLNIPLGAISIFTIVGSGWLGRTLPNMRHHIYTIACLPVITGCVLLWQLPASQTAGRIVGIYLVSFFGSCYVQVIAFGTCNFAGYTKKTIVSAGTFVGYCLGNIIGPLLFDAKFAPGYNESFIGIMIIIVGAGPSGLLLALLLAQKNIPSVVLESWPHLDTRLRATQYGVPATRVFRRAGILDDIRKASIARFPSICWRRVSDHEKLISLDLSLVEDDPDRMTILPLGEIIQILYRHCLEKGEGLIDVKFNHEVTKVGQDDGSAYVDVSIKGEGGTEKTRLTADYVVGCDGASSAVYYDGFQKHNWDGGNYMVDNDHWGLIARRGKGGLWRVTYGDPVTGLTDEEYLARRPAHMKAMLPGHPNPDQYRIQQTNIYNIHNRCVESFKVGRVLLAGDAAHVCNPMGGYGCMTAVLDVGGLADCFIGYYHGLVGEDILEKYAEIRRDIFVRYVNPRSIKNLNRVATSDPHTVLETDKFFGILKDLQRDNNDMRAFLLKVSSIEYDFTKHYKSNQKGQVL